MDKRTEIKLSTKQQQVDLLTDELADAKQAPGFPNDPAARDNVEVLEQRLRDASAELEILRKELDDDD